MNRYLPISISSKPFPVGKAMFLRQSILAVAIATLFAACSQVEDVLHPQADDKESGDLVFTLTRAGEEDDSAGEAAYKGLDLLFYAEAEGENVPAIYDVYQIKSVDADRKVTGSWLGDSHEWGTPTDGKRDVYAFGYKGMVADNKIPVELPQTVNVTDYKEPCLVAYEKDYDNGSTFTLRYLFGKARVYIFGLEHEPLNVKLRVATQGNINYNGINNEEADPVIDLSEDRTDCGMGNMTESDHEYATYGKYWYSSEYILVLPQTLKLGELAISFTCNNQKYEFRPKEDLRLEAGRINNIVLQVKEYEDIPVIDLIHIGVSVGEWNPGGNLLDEGEAEEQNS